MKTISCCLLFILFTHALDAQRAVFLRVYNPEGKKIGRGFIYKTTDSTLLLSRRPNGNMYKEVPAAGISFIRSKHSVAGRIGITSCKVVGYASLVGIVIIAAAIAANNPEHFSHDGLPSNSNEKHLPPDSYGKPLRKYTVNGSMANWQTVKRALDTLW